MVKDPDPAHHKILYDKQTGYFRRDLIVFKNLDLSGAPWTPGRLPEWKEK